MTPTIIVTALGGPQRVTEQVHRYGGLVFADVITPTLARKALDKGADGLVLVCSGAGGHTGEFVMLPFIEEVRSFFEGPLIVGGGIGTGRAIRAVENLGVDFAYLGTRFLATQETLISDAYRAAVWKSCMEDLVPSRAFTGALGNWLCASIMTDHIYIHTVIPTGVDTCIFNCMMLIPKPPKSEKANRYWEKNYQVIRTVFGEDFDIGENIQKGLNTGANTEFLFGRYEIGLHLGKKAIEDALAGRLNVPL